MQPQMTPRMSSIPLAGACRGRMPGHAHATVHAYAFSLGQSATSQQRVGGGRRRRGGGRRRREAAGFGVARVSVPRSHTGHCDGRGGTNAYITRSYSVPFRHPLRYRSDVAMRGHARERNDATSPAGDVNTGRSGAPSLAINC